MTANPLPPARPLTVAEYATLGEEEHGRTELMEGNLVMSLNPTPAHEPGAGYRDEPAVHGTFATDRPFPLRLDLDQIQ